jgi:hypothetical protein
MLRKCIESAAESAVLELPGLQQVWCLSGIMGGELALVHAVNTVASPTRKQKA